jgi:hypothetical protein
MRAGGGQPHGAHRPEPPVARGRRAGTGQLRLPRGVVHLVTPIAATAPCPSLVTFARLPLAGPGERLLKPYKDQSQQIGLYKSEGKKRNRQNQGILGFVERKAATHVRKQPSRATLPLLRG